MCIKSYALNLIKSLKSCYHTVFFKGGTFQSVKCQKFKRNFLLTIKGLYFQFLLNCPGLQPVNGCLKGIFRTKSVPLPASPTNLTKKWNFDMKKPCIFNFNVSENLEWPPCPSSIRNFELSHSKSLNLPEITPGPSNAFQPNLYFVLIIYAPYFYPYSQ